MRTQRFNAMRATHSRGYGRYRAITGGMWVMQSVTNEANRCETEWYARHGKVARTVRFLLWDFPVKTAVYGVGFWLCILACRLTPALGIPMMVPMLFGWVRDIRRSAARAA